MDKKEWKVSVWSDSLQDPAVVRSMLSLLGKGTANRWSFSDPSSADLLLLGNSSVFLPPSQATDSSRIVARLLEPGESSGGGDDALSVNRPLRAMPFIDLLDEAARRLHALRTSAALARVQAQQQAQERIEALPDLDPSPSVLAAAHALHRIRMRRFVTPMALMSADGSMLAMIDIRSAALASVHGMSELLERIGRQFQRVEPRTASNWEQALLQSPRQSLDGLCWQLGKNLAHHFGLAPWLQKDELYRLAHWPDFGAIGNERVGFKLSAQLTRQPLTPHQLCAAASVSFSEVASFLNSASLCGLLAAGPAAQPRNAPARAPVPERLSMIARLRSRLGL